MQHHELESRLAAGEIVVLTIANWQALAPAFAVRAQHDTQMKGLLTIIATSLGLAAVEEPSHTQRVVRLLGDERAVRRFVDERLATYERMWDGCGCKVDYYG